MKQRITIDTIFKELPKYPEFKEGIRRAPKREMLLNEKEIELALKKCIKIHS